MFCAGAFGLDPGVGLRFFAFAGGSVADLGGVGFVGLLSKPSSLVKVVPAEVADAFEWLEDTSSGWSLGEVGLVGS